MGALLGRNVVARRKAAVSIVSLRYTVKIYRSVVTLCLQVILHQISGSPLITAYIKYRRKTDEQSLAVETMSQVATVV